MFSFHESLGQTQEEMFSFHESLGQTPEEMFSFHESLGQTLEEMSEDTNACDLSSNTNTHTQRDKG